MDPVPSLQARDARVLWHPYTQHGLEREFLPVVRAHGSRLELADGRTLIDAISSWWTCLHGHGRPELVRALSEQASVLDHVLFAGATHEPAVRLAERLIELAPDGLARVFFSDDGSTAVEVALKLVLQRWQLRGERARRVFVALEGAYHGDTFGAMSVGDRDPFFRAFEPLLFEVVHVPVAAGSVERALAQLGARAAGVILEPLVQGAAGMRMHPPSFLCDARAACDAHGVPLIADEVMTGFGRTGSLFACGRAGISPDLLCLAKSLTSGLFPLAATLVREELFGEFLSDDKQRMFAHGHTFTAHPIGCAVALASLELALRENVPMRLERLGERIERALQAHRDDPRVLALRRIGGIVALEVATPERGYHATPAQEWRRRAEARGVLLRPLGNVVYALPPASTTDEEADRIAQAMIGVLEEGPWNASR